MRIAFFIYDFVAAKLPLQPWLTIRVVAEYMRDQGHDIHLVTDTDSPAGIDGVTVHTVGSLRGSNSARIRETVSMIKPDSCVVLVTPLNLVSSGWFDALAPAQVYAFAAYPFYDPGEILRAARYIERGEIMSYARHLLIPAFFWRRKLRQFFAGVICQAPGSGEHLNKLTGGNPVARVIVPGIDRQLWPLKESRGDGDPVFLYVGTASRIRGFHIALDAMTRFRGEPIRLRVLARGASEADLERIKRQVSRRGLEAQVEVSGGWMDQPQLVGEIQRVTAVLLPFVLVPSELPVSVLEAIACGTPVIASNIDGLPSTVGKAGLVVRQADADDLANAMRRLCAEPELLATCRAACRAQADEMLTWPAMAQRWEALLSDGR